MKIKINILLTILLLFCVTSYADNLTNEESLLEEVKALGFPVLVIETENNVFPTRERIDAPEGCIGVGITNNEKVPGRVYLIDNETIIYDSKKYEEGESGMTIKVRGNSSAAFTNKYPYKIKLQKKADMLCRGNDNYKDKNWILLPDIYSLNFPVCVEISRLMNKEWYPAYQYVNVIMNNKYSGCYILSESVEQNEKCRVNVNKDDGYIVEYDAYWWNEDIYFKTPMCESFMSYTFKNPEIVSEEDERINFMKSRICDLENAISTLGNYSEKIDVDSWAQWLLAQDIMGTNDAHGTNLFITLHDSEPNTKLNVGPLWDFDTFMLCQDTWSPIHRIFQWHNLLYNRDKSFAKSFCNAWRQYKNMIINGVTSYVLALRNSDFITNLQASRDYDSPKFIKPNYDAKLQTDSIIDWISSRAQWIDEHINDYVFCGSGENLFENATIYEGLTVDADGITWPGYDGIYNTARLEVKAGHTYGFYRNMLPDSWGGQNKFIFSGDMKIQVSEWDTSIITVPENITPAYMYIRYNNETSPEYQENPGKYDITKYYLMDITNDTEPNIENGLNVITRDNTNDKWYDLSGRKVNTDTYKGIVIKARQKRIIR